MAILLTSSHNKLQRTLRCAAFLAAVSFSPPVASDFNQANAEEAIQIVTSVNSNSTGLSREEAAQLFLGYRNRLANGTLVMLIDLPASPIRNYFYKQLTNKNPVQVRATWSRLVFSGRVRPPIEASNPDEALEWVARMPNSIGYLPASIKDERIKTLLVVSNNWVMTTSESPNEHDDH